MDSSQAVERRRELDRLRQAARRKRLSDEQKDEIRRKDRLAHRYYHINY